eukprot:3093829-Rhodomonas_salina.1
MLRTGATTRTSSPRSGAPYPSAHNTLAQYCTFHSTIPSPGAHASVYGGRASRFGGERRLGGADAVNGCVLADSVSGCMCAATIKGSTAANAGGTVSINSSTDAISGSLCARQHIKSQQECFLRQVPPYPHSVLPYPMPLPLISYYLPFARTPYFVLSYPLPLPLTSYYLPDAPTPY